MIKWEKKGLIYSAKGNRWWNKSHAQEPVADIMRDRLRIYYSSRDAGNKSHTSYIETDVNDPGKILFENPEPILPLGERGSFDDDGVMPSCVIGHDGKKYLYYTGWHRAEEYPYLNSMGLAVSEDGGVTFSKYGDEPLIKVVGKGEFTGTSFVMLDDGVFKMWYLHCVKWVEVSGLKEPVYNIKYAESQDGKQWAPSVKGVIELNEDEGGISSPSVLKEDGIYKMWYSYRRSVDYRTNKDSSYRIGYAESNDGIHWIRKDDEAGIERSDEGWDSDMTAYPYVVRKDNTRYMFYNGNGFGKSGLGYAVSNVL
ncbi:MAG: hypothetical protein KDC73_04380 [Ignavibacteriae bacterium]|nr:hypothetical protein [Ignavibacteriota bacterium]MCB9244041.1 hypothetical protein [Ignavibacteriales bacterium]